MAKARQGLTLIELMVATAVTLVMVLAVSQVFVIISGTISTNRASLEMSGQLRGAAFRLQQDFDDVTAPVRPWLDSSAGLGYFEYLEGYGTDFDPDPQQDTNPAQVYESFPQMAGTQRVLFQGQGDSSAGDTDDALFFTVRTSGEPFLGRVMGTLLDRDPNNPGSGPDPFGRRFLFYEPDQPTFETIESDTAEIIWWVQGNTLYRRVLLVRPDIVIPPNSALQPSNAEMPHRFFYSGNDLSVRLEFDEASSRFFRVTNSLGDLTLRQARYAHSPHLPPPSPNAIPPNFPYPVIADVSGLDAAAPRLTVATNVYRRGSDGQWGSAGDDNNDGFDDELDAGAPGSDDILIRYALGEDVILNNVLAFDVQVYDPFVQSRRVISTGDVVRPGSPAFFSPSNPNATEPISLPGGYVDLAYHWPNVSPFLGQLVAADGSWVASNGTVRGDFIGLPPQRSGLLFQRYATYDTWPLDYERDLLNQDGDNLVDEGTNGRDDDLTFGVDDPGERETVPPYAAPISGLKVRIRLFDPGSRQVRQVSVSSDFTTR